MSISASQFLEFCAIFGVPTGGTPTPGPWLPTAGGTMTGNLVVDSGANIELMNGANLEVADVVTLRSQFLQIEAVASSTDISPVETNTVWVIPTATWTIIDPVGLASDDYESGYNFTIKNTSVGDATFTPFGGETIDGVAGAFTVAAGNAVTFMAYGIPTPTAWLVVANYSLGSGGLVWPTYSRQVPVDGFSITIPNNVQNLIIVPASPLATGTIVMPASPVDKQVISVSCEAAGVATLTVNGNGSQTIGDAPTSLAAGQGFAYQYDLANTNWMPIYQPSVGGGGSVTPTQVQQVAFNYGVDSGVADAYVLAAISPAITVLTDGLPIEFTPLNSNLTNSPTVQLNALSPINVVLASGASVAPGDMNPNSTAFLIYSASTGTATLLNPAVSFVTPYNIQLQSYTYAIDSSGTPNAIVLVLDPPVVSNGTINVTFQCANTNTSATTIDVGFGALPLITNAGALVGGELLAGGTYSACFNNALNSYVLFNSSLVGGGVTGLQVQSAAFNSGTDTGSVNSYVIALSPALTVSYQFGQYVEFLPANTNTSYVMTLDAGLGAESILSAGGGFLAVGDVSQNQIAQCVWSGSYWVLLNPYLSYYSGVNMQTRYYDSGVDVGIADNYIVSTGIPEFLNGAPGDNFVLFWTPANSNTTTTPNIVVNGQSPVVIVKQSQAPLAPGDIVGGVNAEIIYSAANSTYQLLNPQTGSGGGSGVTPSQLQDQTYVSTVDTGGGGNAYVVALSPALTSYSNFASFWFTSIHSNTGNATIDVNTIGVIDLLDALGHQLAPGAINAGVPYQVVIYNGAAVLVNPTSVSIAFSAWNSTPTTLAANTVTKVAFQTVEFDIGGNFDNVTNYRFVAPKNGVYHFDAQVWLSSVNILTASMYNIVLYVNGTQFKLGNQGAVYNAAATVSSLSVELQLNATDYVEIYCENGNTSTTVDTNATQVATWFSGYAVGQGLAGSASVTPAQVQAQDFTSATDTGVADAYVLDFSPALTGYLNNFLFMFTPANSNATTTPTVQFNSLTPVTIVKSGGAVAAGDIVAGTPAIALYSVANGNAELINPQTVSGGGGGLTNVNRIYITADGTTTYTPSVGMVKCLVQMVAEGGSGAGASTGGVNTYAYGRAASGGGYDEQWYTAADIGASATLVQSAYHTTPGTGNNPGTSGGNSVFTPGGSGTPFTCNGGSGGSSVVVGLNTTVAIDNEGNVGAGGNGLMPIAYNQAATTAWWAVGSNVFIMLASGGRSHWGDGGNCRASVFAASSTNTAYPGNDAPQGQFVSGVSGYGGGGGGCFAKGASAPDQTGGIGSPPLCIITEYF